MSIWIMTSWLQAKEDEMRSAVLVEKQRREQYQRMALRMQFERLL